MHDTAKMLRTMIDEKYYAMSYDELCTAYLEELDPRVFATAYCKSYKVVVVERMKRYPMLNEDDVASIALERLAYCLQTYTKQDSGGVSFLTYYVNNVMFLLRAEYIKTRQDVRQANYASNSIDEMYENGIDIASEEVMNSELIDIYKGADLDVREVRYCQLVLEGYNGKEIAKMFEVSEPAVYYIKRGIRKKLSAYGLNNND